MFQSLGEGNYQTSHNQKIELNSPNGLVTNPEGDWTNWSLIFEVTGPFEWLNYFTSDWTVSSPI